MHTELGWPYRHGDNRISNIIYLDMLIYLNIARAPGILVRMALHSLDATLTDQTYETKIALFHRLVLASTNLVCKRLDTSTDAIVIKGGTILAVKNLLYLAQDPQLPRE